MAQPRACEQVVRIGGLTTKGGEKQKDGTALFPSASAYIGREKVKDMIVSLLLD